MNIQTTDLEYMAGEFKYFTKTQLDMVKRGFIDEKTACAAITGYFIGMNVMLPLDGKHAMNNKMYDLLDLARDALYGDITPKEVALKYFK